jgi:signal transduction histidine kinase
LWVKNIIERDWGYETILGPLYPYFIIFLVSFSGLSFWNLFSSYKIAQGERIKLQLKYIFLGLFLSALLTTILDGLLPLITGNTQYFWLSPLCIFFLIFFTTLAITRHHLFEIKVILTELLVGTMGIILLILPFLMPTSALRILTSIIFILFCIFGYLLIKTTHREIRRREELRKAYGELEKLDVAKTEFLSIASHQLRTPLTAINGYIGMLQEGVYGKFPENVKNVFNKIYASNKRLMKLVNSLLDISKIEIGRIDFKLEDVQIEEIIESVIDELSGQAKRKRLSLLFEKPKKTLPKIKVDKEKIRQVILNLIDNGIRYTREGEVKVLLKIENLKLKIIVKDTGIGIKKEGIEKLFKMYSRADGIRMFPEGAGLGLYISKKIVEAHYGKIWAESEGEGKGSTFYVELPMITSKTSNY